MICAVASGKGGTGKTTVAVNMAKSFCAEVQLLDCDVEEPNAALFLKGQHTKEEIISILVPEVVDALCNSCGECASFCAYNAIVVVGGMPLIFPEMCHGCGGCSKVCPERAIKEVPKRIGLVETIQAGQITLLQGKIDVGTAMVPTLIRAVKERQRENIPIIIDAPPGTSCPVVSAIRGVDLVILVTEPTPFGLHDLRLAVELVRELDIPHGVVINRVGVGDNRTHHFCAAEKIPVLAEIPDDRRISEVYSKGEIVVEMLPEYRELFQKLVAEALMIAH